MFFVPALLIPSVMNFMQNSVYFCLYSELASVPTYIGLFRKKSKQGEDGGGGGGEGRMVVVVVGRGWLRG